MDSFDLGYKPHDFESPLPGYRGTSLQALSARFPDEESCFMHIFRTRFGDGPACPKCHRSCRWFRARGTRLLQNSCCNATVSPLAGTIFRHTKLPLRLWFYTMLHFANSAEGLSANFLSRHLGITAANAFSLAQRIRTHLASLDWEARVGGEGEKVFLKLNHLRNIRSPQKGQHDRIPVFYLGDSKRVLSTVIIQPNRHRLARIMRDKTLPGSRLITTCMRTSRILSWYGHRKDLVELGTEDCFEANDGMGQITGFHIYFHGPLRNQHGRLDRRHLWRYLKEFEFRFNRRRSSQEIFWDMVSRFPDHNPQIAAKLEHWNSRLDTNPKAIRV